MDVTITALLFVSIFGIVFLLGLRVTRVSNIETEPEAPASIIPTAVFGTATKPLAQAIPQSQNGRRQLGTDLVSAGYYHLTAVDNHLAKRNAALLSFVLFVVLLFSIGVSDGIEIIVAVAGIVISVLIYSLPRMLIRSKAERRTRQIEKAIPDALDMIAMSITGGLPPGRAIDRVANQMKKTHSSLATELQIISRQSQTGSIEQAFSSFADRIDLPEVVAWCSLMRQSHRLGGRIVDSLSEYANRIREDRKNRAEQAGNTASIKLLLPVVTCLTPPIAILLIGPAVLDFRDFINREKDNTVELIENAREFTSRNEVLQQ